MKLIVKDWLCRNSECGYPLGKIKKNGSTVTLVVKNITIIGMAHVPCDECGHTSTWDVNAEALSYLFRTRKERQEAIRASIRELEEGIHQ